MKRVLLALAAIALVSCSPSAKEGTIIPNEVIPEGLKDCKFYILKSSSGGKLHVIRCPNSSVSTATTGKHPVHSATIDEPAGVPVSAVDQRMLQIDANIAKTEMTIKRLQLERAELEREKLK